MRVGMWRRHSCLPGRDSSRPSSSRAGQTPRRVSARQAESLALSQAESLRHKQEATR
jgi:hypothetical protein